MNLLNLLTTEKNVAGIEISDSVVRIAFLRPKESKRWQIRGKKGLAPSASDALEYDLLLIEEPIASNIIENGIVTDPDLLGQALKDIWVRAKLDTNYAIVAIPDNTIYSRIFSFPKGVEGSRLTEAMRLAIGFQLPIKIEETYLDWELTTGTKTTNEILLSTIPRAVADGYVGALESAGVKTLALESQLASIARVIKHKAGESKLITSKNPDGVTIFIIKDGILQFSRTLPTKFVHEDKRAEEIRKIKTSYEAEYGEVVNEMELNDLAINDSFAPYKIKEPTTKWLIALGATMRAQTAEGADNFISLLPVGTEDAYTYQKMTTFAVLMRNLTISVSIFFILAYLGTYLFMFSVSKNINSTITTLSTSSFYPEILAKEDWVQRVNELTFASQSILSQTPLWSIVLTEVNSRLIEGITASAFTATSFTEKMSLVGTAKDRATLNRFKKYLEESAMFSGVDVPFTNIEQRADIPFSASFRIKDPSALYYGQSESHKVTSP